MAKEKKTDPAPKVEKEEKEERKEKIVFRPAPTPPHVAELESLAIRIATGTSTVRDETRLRQIGTALARNLNG